MPAAEYASRRERVLAELKSKQKGAVALLFAGDARGEDPYRPHPHFEYLTGIDDEPGAMLLLDPNEPVASRRAVLFLRPLDPEVERWDGLREGIGSSLRTRYGIATIMRHRYLGRTLSTATVRAAGCITHCFPVKEPRSSPPICCRSTTAPTRRRRSAPVPSAM